MNIRTEDSSSRAKRTRFRAAAVAAAQAVLEAKTKASQEDGGTFAIQRAHIGMPEGTTLVSDASGGAWVSLEVFVTDDEIRKHLTAQVEELMTYVNT